MKSALDAEEAIEPVKDGDQDCCPGTIYMHQPYMVCPPAYMTPVYVHLAYLALVY